MIKNAAILKVLHHLKTCLGPDKFQVTDHWECDLIAIGIASAADPQRLVYLCLASGEASFDVRLETAPKDGSELPYADAGQFDDVDLETLTAIIAEHLGIRLDRSADAKLLK